MKVFKVFIKATIGAAYIEAEGLDEAVEKLFEINGDGDGDGVRFEYFDDPIVDFVDRDDIEEEEPSETHDRLVRPDDINQTLEDAFKL